MSGLGKLLIVSLIFILLDFFDLWLGPGLSAMFSVRRLYLLYPSLFHRRHSRISTDIFTRNRKR